MTLPLSWKINFPRELSNGFCKIRLLKFRRLDSELDSKWIMGSLPELGKLFCFSHDVLVFEHWGIYLVADKLKELTESLLVSLTSLSGSKFEVNFW